MTIARDPTQNPFNITKAVDFSDREIFDYWVDISEKGGFEELVKPTMTMPMLILGGKGSGKTHLMRYYSYSLQKIRHEGGLVSGITRDKYLGIYLRCGGLNAARFKGKGQLESAWVDVFAYYMELWLSQLVLGTVCDVFSGHDELGQHEAQICNEIVGLFDQVDGTPPTTIAQVVAHIQCLQKRLDMAVNNCAIRRSGLDVNITVTRGRLIFGLPRVFSQNLPSFGNCLFLYLIDEFENLADYQQQYVNTLLREREGPCSIKIGARLYGIRTYSTFSAGEDNKEGSEFETLILDQRMRAKRFEPEYASFARRLIVKRLTEQGFFPESADPQRQSDLADSLSKFFEEPEGGDFEAAETTFVIEKYAGKERPYFASLRKNLEKGIEGGWTPRDFSKTDVDYVIAHLSHPERPLLEKVNCLLFYKDWSAKEDLKTAAELIARELSEYLAGNTGRYGQTLDHFKSDLLAQLRRECDQKQQYVGIETLIAMSWGLPRNLLIVLKKIYSWAIFNGKNPFRNDPISMAEQAIGVKEAAEWFFRDARMSGADGKILQDSIGRLGELFRSIRFSHKPTECSLVTFSCDLSRVSEESRRVIDLAQKWSLLVDVGVQRDRNSARVDVKLQLNRMLAPRWDLTISRRGVLPLPEDDVNAIFDINHAANFDRMLADRIARMTAPAFGHAPPRAARRDDDFLLPGFGDA